MSTFTVPVVTIKNIVPIEGADAIEVAEVLGYRCVVKKGQFQAGGLAVYIPEDAVLPRDVLDALGLVDKLAGSEKNRVKAIKLRGVVSQGILYPVSNPQVGKFTVTVPHQNGATTVLTVNEGDDVSSLMEITKYEPPIPVHMSGEVCNMRGSTVPYDIENIQRYNNVLQPGEEVVFTEKLHGTFCCIAISPYISSDELLNGNAFAYSKGLGAQGLVFKNNERNANNIYHRTLVENFAALQEIAAQERTAVYVFGEVFGQGIQDLTYGITKPEFRVFDMYIGRPGSGNFLSYEQLIARCKNAFNTVPHLYRGPYSKEVELRIRSGMDAINGANIREGIVIKPVTERKDPTLGRVILKSVSPEYLLRKGNTTEYQ